MNSRRRIGVVAVGALLLPLLLPLSAQAAVPQPGYIVSSSSPDDHAIDMNNACQAQYHGTGLHAATANSSDPYSWKCYRGSVLLGGLPHLDIYCSTKYQGGMVVLTPPHDANNWKCRSPSQPPVAVPAPTPIGTPAPILTPEQQKKLKELLDKANNERKAVVCGVYIGKGLYQIALWLNQVAIESKGQGLPLPPPSGQAAVYTGQCNLIDWKELQVVKLIQWPINDPLLGTPQPDLVPPSL